MLASKGLCANFGDCPPTPDASTLGFIMLGMLGCAILIGLLGAWLLTR